MNIETAKTKKKELSEKIADLVNGYEKETGLKVASINLFPVVYVEKDRNKRIFIHGVKINVGI